MILPRRRRAAIFAEIASDLCTALYFDPEISSTGIEKLSTGIAAEDALCNCLAGVKPGKLDFYALLPLQAVTFSSLDITASFKKKNAKAFIETNSGYFDKSNTAICYDFWFSGKQDTEKLNIATISSNEIESVYCLAEKFDIRPVCVTIAELVIANALRMQINYVLVLSRGSGSAVLYMQHNRLAHSRFIKHKPVNMEDGDVLVGPIIEELNLIRNVSELDNLQVLFFSERQELNDKLFKELQREDGFTLVTLGSVLPTCPEQINKNIGGLACYLMAKIGAGI